MRKQRFRTSFFGDEPDYRARYFGGGTPIIMGGQSDAEMQAQLNRAALENEKMLAQAADEQLRLQRELDTRDKEMELMMQQQASQTELDLARAQKALDVELDALSDEQAQDSLKSDFSALEAALAAGLGSAKDSGNSDVRPI